MARTRAALTESAGAAVWALPDDELTACLEEAWAGVQQLTAVTAHLIRQAEARSIPKSEAASSTVVWLRQRFRIAPWTGKRLQMLGAALDASPSLDAAVSAGSVSVDQALAIAEAIEDLPDDTGRDMVAEAESALISFASDFDPIVLSRLGARILAHIDPDAADRHDEVALKRQQERAHRRRGFTLSPLGNGQVRLSGRLSTAAAATVKAALDPLCHPSRDAGSDQPRTPEQRRADALVDICALALRTGDLPTTGGEPPQVVVTIPIETLRNTPPSDPETPTVVPPATPGAKPGGPAAGRGPRSGSPATTCKPAANRDPAAPPQAGRSALLDDGTPVSASDARLMACDALVIPAVLGTDGQVLDVGRARRLFTGPIRRALILRDGGCSFPGCDRPPAWSEGHHIVPWADGGVTALSNACLLCRHHHRLIHDDWQVRLHEDGRPEFLPPASLDPQRRPRRKAYHQRL
ncbi:hypothetical protein Ate02nite_31260 [Paractinoplanes tereljensis]|uniref:HNH nuclease domain-containing protein n=1 Tax=Paractinoplanes tereljensis TaxID=571912 RepID=A0A919NLY8_9ACTN|nr:hypothetical protein Ate02nite_31260 [Actinoplanes tereljensis]